MPPVEVAEALLAVDDSDDREVDGVSVRRNDASSEGCSVGHRMK